MRLLRHGGPRAGVLAGALLACGCGAAAFACEQSDECSGADPGGRCEADGWCSFPDAACDSGRRYGALAGGGLAGQCVADDGTSTGTQTSSAAADEGTTVDPSIASLEGTSATDTRGDSESGGTTGAAPVCGDGVRDPGEQCDRGPDNGGGGECRDDCVLNVCGDGYVGPGESCDGTPGCTPQCTPFGCGDGEVTRGEECDDAAPIAVDCTDLGWFGGALSCDACRLDASACEGCGEDGCSFDPCVPDDARAGCPPGEYCAAIGEVGTCTADCEVDADCPADVPSTCYAGMGLNLCLPTCIDGGCPMGMACAPTMPPVCVFE